MAVRWVWGITDVLQWQRVIKPLLCMAGRSGCVSRSEEGREGGQGDGFICWMGACSASSVGVGETQQRLEAGLKYALFPILAVPAAAAAARARVRRSAFSLASCLAALPPPGMLAAAAPVISD